MRILVAEDEKDLAFLMQFELQKAGYSVAIANDGIKALEVLSQDPFDLVFRRLSGEAIRDFGTHRTDRSDLSKDAS